MDHDARYLKYDLLNLANLKTLNSGFIDPERDSDLKRVNLKSINLNACKPV